MQQKIKTTLLLAIVAIATIAFCGCTVQFKGEKVEFEGQVNSTYKLDKVELFDMQIAKF